MISGHLSPNCHNQKIINQSTGSAPTSFAWERPRLNLERRRRPSALYGEGAPAVAACPRVGRGSRTLPPSPGRHLPARPFPRGFQPGSRPSARVAGDFLVRAAKKRGAARRSGAESMPRAARGRGHRGAGCSAARPLPPPARGSRSAPRPSPRLHASLGGEGGARKRRVRREAQLRAWGRQEPRSRPRERLRPERAAETKATVSAAPVPVARRPTLLAVAAPWAGARSPEPLAPRAPGRARPGPARCGQWAEPAAPFSGLGEVLMRTLPLVFLPLPPRNGYLLSSEFTAAGRLRKLAARLM